MEMRAEAAVQVERLSRQYGARAALSDVSLEVQAGEMFGLLGPNGGGKTTLFRILSTLLPPSSGRAAILGLDVVAKAHEVRRRIGVVFQAPNLDRKLTAAENLRYHGQLYGLSGSVLRARIEELLEQLDLQEKRNALVETLSGGQRRRVELAKGLLHRPPVLLLDEPSTGLDPGARRGLWEALQAVRSANGVTVLFTTHLLEEAESCDRLAILDRGSMVAMGAPEQLKKEIGGEVIVIDAYRPELLSEHLREKFQVEVTTLGGKLRFDHPRGHEFIPQLVEAFPGEIQSVMVAKPSLEDVFFRRTGRSFWENLSLNGTGMGAGPAAPRGHA